MKELGVLLHRDWLEFRKKYISYIFIWFSFPMILYLFTVIPLNPHIDKVGLMNFKHWASPGIWICSSGLLSFVYCYTKLKHLLHNKDYIHKYLKAPLSNGQFLASLLISSVIIGIVQLIISITITTGLNNDSWNFIQLGIIFLNLTTILFFCSTIGLLFGIYVKDDLFAALMCFIMFIVFSFVFGTLVPIEESYNKFLILIRNLPFYKVVLNIQLVYASQNTIILPLVVMNIINILIFIILTAISYKKFRK